MAVRPFLFTVATDPAADGQWVLYSDTGYGERGQDPARTDGWQQYVGAQGRVGWGLTVLGRLGFGTKEDGGVGNLEEAEVLKDVLTGAAPLSAGVGARRELDGSFTALGRVVFGRTFAKDDLFTNVRFERSFERDRDELDLMASVAWMHRFGDVASAGVEVLAQDLEGLWEPDEAEGGARLFIGPTVRAAIPATSFYLALGGGPVLRASRSPRINDAPRDLSTRSGYAIRLSIGFQPPSSASAR